MTDTARDDPPVPHRRSRRPTLDDLRDRLARTRWPGEPGVDGWSRGVPLGYLQELADYWARRLRLARAGGRAERAPAVRRPTIDGQPIHFLHVRSPEPDALPLILTHGWPSSPVEFLDVIGPLTDPRAHGGDPADAFHVVVPVAARLRVLDAAARAGWGNLFRVAQAWAELMTRLGYERYAVQGTDVGSGVAGMLAMVAPAGWSACTSPARPRAMPFGPPLDSTACSGADRERAERFNPFQRGRASATCTCRRPGRRRSAYALTDSPVGQLAWIVEKFHEWTDPAAELPEDAVDRDQLLTERQHLLVHRRRALVGPRHLRGHAGLARRWSRAQRREPAPARARRRRRRRASRCSPPTPRSAACMDPDGTIAHWTEFDRGGHFPAMEVPDLLADDLRDVLPRAPLARRGAEQLGAHRRQRLGDEPHERLRADGDARPAGHAHLAPGQIRTPRRRSAVEEARRRRRRARRAGSSPPRAPARCPPPRERGREARAASTSPAALGEPVRPARLARPPRAPARLTLKGSCTCCRYGTSSGGATA